MSWEGEKNKRVVTWEGEKGGRVVRWQGEEGRKVGSWFYSRMGNAGRAKDLIFLFLMLINEIKEQGKLKFFLRSHRDGKTLLRSYASS